MCELSIKASALCPNLPSYESLKGRVRHLIADSPFVERSAEEQRALYEKWLQSANKDSRHLRWPKEPVMHPHIELEALREMGE